MTIYYRGPCALITHEVFNVRWPVCESFPLRDLKSIHIVQHDKRFNAAGIAFLRIGTLLLAVAAIFVAAFAWTAIDSAEVVVVALLVTTVSSVVATGCWRVPAQSFELVAIFQGRQICLLRTVDKGELGQVCRGLLRALEYRSER